MQISKRSKPVRGWLTANVQKKKYFCFSNRLFLQSRSPRVGRVGRCVFTITVFGMRFFSCKSGVNEEKIKKDLKVAHCWEGGWTSVRDERKGEKGEPMNRQTARMRRVLSGVARGSHSALPPTHSELCLW